VRWKSGKAERWKGVTPGAVTPSVVTPSAVTPSAVTPSAVTPSVVEGRGATGPCLDYACPPTGRLGMTIPRHRSPITGHYSCFIK
jgi:hypothetical protein